MNSKEMHAEAEAIAKRITEPLIKSIRDGLKEIDVKMADERLEELQECYEIVLKTARRAVRDLRHAIDQIPADNEFREMITLRYQNFKTIFDDVADYRIKMHMEMNRMECENKSLHEMLHRDEK